MQKREGRSFAPLPTPLPRPDLGSTGRKSAVLPAGAFGSPLPPLTSALSRRAALFGAVTVAGVTAASAVPSLAASGPDAALMAQAAAFLSLCKQEEQAWHDLPDDDQVEDTPALTACRVLSQACRDAGETLAAVPARTPADLAVKASSMLALVGTSIDTQANFSEHHDLIASIIKDAAQLRGGSYA